MQPKTRTQILEVVLKDKTKKGFQDISTGMGKLKGKFTDVNQGFATFDRKAGAAIANVGKASLALGATAGVAAAGIFKLAQASSSASEAQRFFNHTFGDSGEGLKQLSKASKNTIADMELMSIANRASLLGVTSSVDDLSKLMVTARLRGKAMGLTTEQAFNDIVTGIGRGSPLILDNLGIKIPDALKELMQDMGETEKTQALLNFAMADGATLAEQMGGDILTTADKFQQMQASINNTKQVLGESFAPLVVSVMDNWVTPAINRFGEVVKLNMENSEGFWDEFVDHVARKAGTEGSGGILGTLEQLGVEMANFFLNIVPFNLSQSETFWTDYRKHAEAQMGSDNWLTKAEGVLGEFISVLAINLSESEDLWDDFKDYLDNIWEGIKDGFSDLLDGLKTDFKEFASALYVPTSAGADSYEENVPSIFNRASGGMTSGATITGESGPELAIYPQGTKILNADRTAEVLSGGDTTINITVGSVNDETMIRKITDAVEQAEAQRNRLNQLNAGY